MGVCLVRSVLLHIYMTCGHLPQFGLTAGVWNTKHLLLTKPNLFPTGFCLKCYTGTLRIAQGRRDFLWLFKGFIALALSFRFMAHFKLILCMVWGEGPNSSVSVWISTCHGTIYWTTTLSPLKTVEPLPWVIWSWIHGLTSGLSTLFHWPVCQLLPKTRCFTAVALL